MGAELNKDPRVLAATAASVCCLDILGPSYLLLSWVEAKHQWHCLSRRIPLEWQENMYLPFFTRIGFKHQEKDIFFFVPR